MAKAKKSSSKKSTKHPLLTDVDQAVVFIRIDGQPIKSLLDLVAHLEEMQDHVFYHHVTADRNDFATWIHDVLKDKELAEKIAHIKDRHHTAYTILRHIISKLT